MYSGKSFFFGICTGSAATGGWIRAEGGGTPVTGEAGVECYRVETGQPSGWSNSTCKTPAMGFSGFVKIQELTPVWMDLVAGENTIYPQNKEHQLKVKNEGSFKLKSKTALFGNILIECAKATGSGNLWDGVNYGEDNAVFIFAECEAKSSTAGTCKGVEVSSAKAYSELTWKYAGKSEELEELAGTPQQKIYDAFAPTAEPKEGKAVLLAIILPKSCTAAGEFSVTAGGTETTFVDQEGKSHSVVWGTAGLVEPQNENVVKNSINWAAPNVTILHQQDAQIKTTLDFAGSPAELEGKLAVELNNGEKFGSLYE
jgi:hypothetical protein